MRAGAFAVHVLTASGAGLALLSLILAVGGEWAAMFLCLGVALIVDAIDGPLARKLNVVEKLPRWSGEQLDHVIDFTTYVFVPAYAIAASGLLPGVMAIPSGIIIVVSGALYFADLEMKTDDNYFRGFPAVWNVIAFYQFILEPPPWISVAVIVTLAGLTFAPVRFVHPLRVMRLRAVSISLMVIWAALALVAVMSNLDPGPWVAGGLGVIALYFLGAGLLRPRA